jgi:hypothetical protein
VLSYRACRHRTAYPAAICFGRLKKPVSLMRCGVCGPFVEASTVFCRDHEAELVRVANGAIEEGGAIGMVAIGVIELAGVAFAGDAIALDVTEVGASSAEIAGGDARVARLDDDAPATGRNDAGARLETNTHATAELRWLDVTSRPRAAHAGLTGLPEHLLPKAGQANLRGVARATGLRFELVVGHDADLHGWLETVHAIKLKDYKMTSI